MINGLGTCVCLNPKVCKIFGFAQCLRFGVQVGMIVGFGFYGQGHIGLCSD